MPKQHSSPPEACEHRKGSLDDARRRKMIDRLRRIEGQVRGIQRMVDEDRYCPDILTQISAIQESLRSSAQVLLESHLRHCVTDAIRSSDPGRSEEVYRELMDLFRKYAR
ncbi:MAG TPA: metal-sensitive transcriptional regulator [Thermoanaerobaculia bacterium]|nr:metal-sensitive transcriptional regulator [Thermoanaerobaculia bacterium]